MENKDKFNIEFSTFKDINKSNLNNYFLKINKKNIIFSKNIEILDSIVKIISNNIIGNLTISITNDKGLVLGKLFFKNLQFKKIDNVINFNYNLKYNGKLKVTYTYNELIYINKDLEEYSLDTYDSTGEVNLSSLLVKNR